jgi:hypothetical protein
MPLTTVLWKLIAKVPEDCGRKSTRDTTKMMSAEKNSTIKIASAKVHLKPKSLLSSAQF